MADQLATPEDLAALMQQELDRATATLLIETATAVVQAACGQRIVRVDNDTVTLHLDEYDPRCWLALPERPVVSVASVKLGTTDITDWTSDSGRNRLYRLNGWRAGWYDLSPTQVTVTYTHGYAVGDQRLQLARSATLAFASQGYANPTGAMREQIDDYSVQYAEMAARMEATPAMVRALRQQYGRSRNSVRLIRS